MTIYLQPPGSMHCTYYAVMNACQQRGAPVPTLERLHELAPPTRPTGTATAWEQVQALEAMGWQTGRILISPESGARFIITALLNAGVTVILQHNHLAGPGGIFHSVVAESAELDVLTVLCSIQGRTRIPWTMFDRGDDVGISHELVYAQPVR